MAMETAPDPSPRYNAHLAGIGLQHRRDDRIEGQNGLGLGQRITQLLVILPRADPRQLALCAVQRSGITPAFGQTAAADLRRGELIARELLDLIRPGCQQPQVIERADVLLRLEE